MPEDLVLDTQPELDVPDLSALFFEEEVHLDNSVESESGSAEAASLEKIEEHQKGLPFLNWEGKK